MISSISATIDAIPKIQFKIFKMLFINITVDSQLIQIKYTDTSEITSHNNQIITGNIDAQNRFFFHAILHTMYKSQTGIIASRHFLPAFLNIIHKQIILNNTIIRLITN